jgi:hypothetical protein
MVTGESMAQPTRLSRSTTSAQFKLAERSERDKVAPSNGPVLLSCRGLG